MDFIPHIENPSKSVGVRARPFNRPDPADNALSVVFFWKEFKNEERSRRDGCIRFDQQPWVKIFIPGSKSELDREVQEKDKARFPDEYNAFITRQTPPEGYLLQHWPILDRARVAELVANRIHTVEMLAGITDSNLDILGMGGRELRQKAIDFLKASKGAMALSDLRDENDKLRLDMDSMKQQLNAMNQQLFALKPHRAEPAAMNLPVPEILERYVAESPKTIPLTEIEKENPFVAIEEPEVLNKKKK